ncbi:MAG: 16S rRNA (cytosine(1402)-N(4))-methyltransferase RsmH [Rhodothalassiaceae bacterium]
MSMKHIPVLLEETIAALAPAPGACFVDGTFGAGGYSRALLGAAEDVRVYAIDRDPEAIRRGAALAAASGGRLILIEGRFSQMEELLARHGIRQVDGIVLDIGVSSFQLETGARGFSFQIDGPLDMRMGREGETAADVLNRSDEQTLTDIFRRLGEEPQARRIARAVIAARAVRPLSSTREFADLVERALGGRRKGPAGRTHPATRSFQALRIHVNDELGELERALLAAERLLVPGGRLAVVSFHSLEDRIVKTFLAERAGRRDSVSRHRPPDPARRPAPSFRLPRTGGIVPGAAERESNPRARSARLRVAIRTDAPAWEQAA